MNREEERVNFDNKMVRTLTELKKKKRNDEPRMAQSGLARAKKTVKLTYKKYVIYLFLLYTFCHLSTTTSELQLCYF